MTLLGCSLSVFIEPFVLFPSALVSSHRFFIKWMDKYTSHLFIRSMSSAPKLFSFVFYLPRAITPAPVSKTSESSPPHTHTHTLSFWCCVYSCFVNDRSVAAEVNGRGTERTGGNGAGRRRWGRRVKPISMSIRGPTRERLLSQCQGIPVTSRAKLRWYFNAARQLLLQGEVYNKDGDFHRVTFLLYRIILKAYMIAI